MKKTFFLTTSAVFLTFSFGSSSMLSFEDEVPRPTSLDLVGFEDEVPRPTSFDKVAFEDEVPRPTSIEKPFA